MDRVYVRVMEIYQKMLAHFGPRGWWPGDSPLEICVGAILTQSVSWKNVTLAVANLKEAGLMNLQALYDSPIEKIEACIIPTLYFRMKAQKIKAFVKHIQEIHGGSLEGFLSQELPVLRQELLGIWGIGPETADSIILYAAEKPVFVVDAYTRRIFSRLGLVPEKVSYEEMQEFFMKRLPPDVPLFNEYHALIVGVGHRFCQSKKPKCGECPLDCGGLSNDGRTQSREMT